MIDCVIYINISFTEYKFVVVFILFIFCVVDRVDLFGIRFQLFDLLILLVCLDNEFWRYLDKLIIIIINNSVYPCSVQTNASCIANIVIEHLEFGH